MAWTTPGSWTGSPSESYFNTHIRDNTQYLYDNISGGGWTSFTATPTNLTVGNGTLTAKYALAGMTVFFYVQFTFGSTSSISGSVSFALPATAVTYLARHPIGQAVFVDATGSIWHGRAVWGSTTTCTMQSDLVSGTGIVTAALSSTSPFTWTTSDVIQVHGFYEKA